MNGDKYNISRVSGKQSELVAMPKPLYEGEETSFYLPGERGRMEKSQQRRRRRNTQSIIQKPHRGRRVAAQQYNNRITYNQNEASAISKRTNEARARRQHCESYDRVWPEYFLGRSSSNRIGNGSASAGDADDESKADDDDDDGHADDGNGSVSDDGSLYDFESNDGNDDDELDSDSGDNNSNDSNDGDDDGDDNDFDDGDDGDYQES